MYWTKKHVFVCTASHCMSKGANDVVGRLRLDIVRKGLDAEIMINNCNTIDLCDIGPNVIVYPDNIIYRGVTVKDLPEIVESLRNDTVVDRLLLSADTPEEQARKAFYVEMLAAESPLTDVAVEAIVAQHDYDAVWMNEQMRRGFLAKKIDKESGDSFFQVTKKSRVRYSI